MKKIIDYLKTVDKKVWIIGGISLAVAVALLIMFFTLGAGNGGGETTEEPSLSQTDTAETTPPITAEFGDGGVDPENLDSAEETGIDLQFIKPPSKENRAVGIDVSKWQGKIDWQKVKESGIEFAYVRVGYRGENGKLYKDDNADYNIQKANEAGILVGVYFFSTAINEAEALEEANFTLETIKGYSISYPVVYDCEGYRKAESRMNGLSAEARTDNAVKFLETVKGAGYDTMFYASRNDMLISIYWQVSRITDNYKVWIAQYPDVTYPEKDTPDYPGRFDAWQYTNMGKVNGIDGYVDMVVSYFTCRKAEPKDKNYTPPEAQIPTTDEDKIYTAVNENVTAKSETNLRTMASTKSDVVATLRNGETAVRVGIGSNGWSKLKYYGQTVYAITSYLTTDVGEGVAPPSSGADMVHGNLFEAKNDRVTAKNEVNLRSLPTTDSVVIATLKKGDFLDRTAVSDKGWSRLTYNGQTVYAVTNLLTTTVETEGETTEKETAPPKTEGFKAVSDRVTAKFETNLRTYPSTTDSEVVYTLKNGEFVERVGVHTNGWSKLIYKGQTVYAVTSYLLTEDSVTADTAEGTDSVEVTGSQTEETSEPTVETQSTNAAQN